MGLAACSLQCRPVGLTRNLSTSVLGSLPCVLPSFFSRFNFAELESPSASGLADTSAETEGEFQLHVTPVEPWRARLQGYGNVGGNVR